MVSANESENLELREKIVTRYITYFTMPSKIRVTIGTLIGVDPEKGWCLSSIFMTTSATSYIQKVKLMQDFKLFDP